MTGSIVQINISPGGIPKCPIPEAEVLSGGIRGDSWAHPKIHGGPNQALLLIGVEAIDHLRSFGYPLFYGALGENLTIAGLDRTRMRAGQRYRAGGVLLDLTKLREPCATLDEYGIGIQRLMYDKFVKDGDVGSPKWGLGGFYARVVEPGIIRVQDTITLVDHGVPSPHASSPSVP